jgi:hypothetical protein
MLVGEQILGAEELEVGLVIIEDVTGCSKVDVDGTVAVSWPDGEVRERGVVELLRLLDNKDSVVNDGVAVPALVAVDDSGGELNELDGEDDVVIDVEVVVEDMSDVTYELDELARVAVES